MQVESDIVPVSHASSRILGFRIVRIVLGGLLLTAAALKVHGLALDPLSQDYPFGFPRLLIAAIEVEIVLGFWLWSGWAVRASWLSTLAFLLIGASTSLYKALDGQPSCGCFGRVTASPWLTLGLDTILIGALIAFRPSRAADMNQPAWARHLLSTGLGAIALFAVIGGAFLLTTDDPLATLARLRGEPITAEPSVTWLGGGAPNEERTITISLTNRSSRQVQIVGGSANCACIVTDALPISIPEGETRPLTVRVFFQGQPGVFQRSFMLYTDENTKPLVKARFRGRVIDSPAP